LLISELEEDILESMLGAGADTVTESALHLEHRADAAEKRKRSPPSSVKAILPRKRQDLH
jgi:hypothetical protein